MSSIEAHHHHVVLRGLSPLIETCTIRQGDRQIFTDGNSQSSDDIWGRPCDRIHQPRTERKRRVLQMRNMFACDFFQKRALEITAGVSDFPCESLQLPVLPRVDEAGKQDSRLFELPRQMYYIMKFSDHRLFSKTELEKPQETQYALCQLLRRTCVAGHSLQQVDHIAAKAETSHRRQLQVVDVVDRRTLP